MIEYSRVTGATVCGKELSLSTANVVCRQLGYRRALSTTAILQSHTKTSWYWFESINCTGNEEQLSDCPFHFSKNGNCSRGMVAMVTCDRKFIYCEKFD